MGRVSGPQEKSRGTGSRSWRFVRVESGTEEGSRARECSCCGEGRPSWDILEFDAYPPRIEKRVQRPSSSKISPNRSGTSVHSDFNMARAQWISQKTKGGGEQSGRTFWPALPPTRANRTQSPALISLCDWSDVLTRFISWTTSQIQPSWRMRKPPLS
jgi:hypothetical protein